MCPFLLRSRAGWDPGVSNRSGPDSACGAPLGKALAGPVISPEGLQGGNIFTGVAF